MRQRKASSGAEAGIEAPGGLKHRWNEVRRIERVARDRVVAISIERRDALDLDTALTQSAGYPQRDFRLIYADRTLAWEPLVGLYDGRRCDGVVRLIHKRSLVAGPGIAAEEVMLHDHGVAALKPYAIVNNPKIGIV